MWVLLFGILLMLSHKKFNSFRTNRMNGEIEMRIPSRANNSQYGFRQNAAPKGSIKCLRYLLLILK